MNKTKGNITIRSSNPSDVEQLVLWWSSGKVMAHAGFPKGIKTDKRKLKEEIIKASLSEFPDLDRLIILIDKKPIGEMNYRLKSENVYEIGIKICDFDYHNKGIGSKAMGLLMEYLFDDRNAEKIILDTNLNNTGAQRFYERLGFKKVSINVNSWKNQLGELQSSVDYEINKENYYSYKE